MRNFLAIGLLALSFSANAADLVSTFKSLNNNRKGPFSLNYSQGTQGRAVVNQGDAPGQYQFQAAFRNEIGQALATQFDFYTANLFTTNYYELQGEYVYGNAYGSHPIDHKALLAAAPKAFPKAASMVRNWVLEKHYVNFFPDSAIVRGFKLRGISGAEFEQPYAYYFFNFYLSSMAEDRQFLPAFLLTKGSPLAESSSLERARTLIAAVYDNAATYYNPQDPAMRRLYDLRNIIHNQVSQNVIGLIDNFARQYPELYQDPRIAEVRSILSSYYSVGANKIVEQAKKAGQTDLQNAAAALAKSGGSPDRYLALSQQLANLRIAIADNNRIPYEKKTDNLILMYMTSQYLNKELSSVGSVTSKDILKSVVNVIFSEGFLIQDNWKYFIGEIDGAATVGAAGELLPDVVGIATDTLTQAFAPAYDNWVKVEPKMNYFMDNTIKSSSLNTVSIIAKKIKK